jgi:hypothetical protein
MAASLSLRQLSEPPTDGGSDNRGPGFQAFTIVMLFITIIPITLRMWSRSLIVPRGRHEFRFWWDDWMACAAVPFIVAQSTTAFVWIQLGLGRHYYELDPSALATSMKILFANYFIYDIALWLTKTSALLFFRRIFSKRRSPTWFNMALLVTHGLNTAWLVGILLATIFFCDPIPKQWTPDLPGHCGQVSTLWIGSAISNVIIDFIILILPLPMIWGLHTSSRRRAGISIIFALAYCVIIVSIGRLVILFLDPENIFGPDISYEAIPVLYWVTGEAPIAVLSICLPAMITLGHRLTTTYVAPMASRISTVLDSRGSSGGIKSKSGNFTHSVGEDGIDLGSVKRPTMSMSSHTSMDTIYGILNGPYTAHIQGGVPTDDLDDDVPGGIRVKQDIRIVRG